MKATIEECRWLYNHLLEERKRTYEETGSSPGLYKQHAALPALKQERPTSATVHSRVLQNVAARVDFALQAFFRRVREGEIDPGYPRFRGKGRYDSFCYPQFGFKIVGQRIRLSRIGNVKAVLHRPIEGEIKTCCVRRTSTDKWYATFSCEVEPVVLDSRDSAVGIDVGLVSFATLFNGEKIANPRFLRRDERRLKRAQRRREKAPKGSVRMVHNHCLAKSIHDAAWRQFLVFLAFKAECAGRRVVLVNPAHTSQDCSNPTCGHRQSVSLSDRVFVCPCCGLMIDRDLNAALNILRLGLQSLAHA